ncbi:MAG: LamG domain-containing protein, partial [Bacteroidia bacterium]
PTSSVKILPWYLEGKMRNASNRGVFESPVHTLQKPSVQISADKLKSACVRDTLFLVDYSAHYKTGATFFWTITPSPSYISSRSVENPKVVFGSAGSYTVSLVVSDSLGTDSQTINAFYSVTEGCNIDPIPGSALQISADGQRALTAPLNITSNTVTITAWVKPSQIQSDYSGIVMNFASVSSAGGLNVRQNNELGYHWPGGSWWWSSGLTLTPGEWAHVALVITPTSATIYKNGVGRTHTIALSPCEFRELAIGSYRDWTSRTFKGLIDEVCFYNRSLNQAEIRESMHLTKSGIYANNLIAYYQFNENEGFVQDKMGIDHASLVAGAARSSSSVPVAGGVSDRLTINSSNATTFPNTQVTMKFSSTGTNPNGEIVVSRLNYQPDVVPNSQDSMSRYYWVINNFGSNASFSPMQELW